MSLRKILMFTVMLLFSLMLNGMNRIYQEKTENEITTHRFEIEPTNNGFSIHLESTKGESIVKQDFQLDNKLATHFWSFESPYDNINVTASMKDGKIYLKGRGRGKEIKKIFDIDKYPWNQSFNIGLEKFALGEKQSMKFWAIGTSGPGYMKITKFKVKRKKNETILIHNQKVEAVYITISLTGLLSMFWTGNYWFRKSDGEFLRYRGKNGPGKPVSLMEIVLEEK